MIILIAGATHTGKTQLAQQLLEKYRYPTLSIDHLKMGFIRSHMTDLSVSDDEQLTEFMWPFIKELIKTAIENKQNLILEGCYIPFDYTRYFDQYYLSEIKYICLVMSESYIQEKFDDIRSYANVIESRLCDEIEMEQLIRENNRNLDLCHQNGNNYILIHHYDELMLQVEKILKEKSH